jgi:serine/threonine protein kinase
MKNRRHSSRETSPAHWHLAMIGTRIGQYRVLQVLGEGGMGRVLLAEHAVMRTRHAIKVLHDELSRNEMIVQRFLNEARSAGAIGHRNVVEVTHVDQIEGGGPWYLVMKYLEGQTLTSLLARSTAPPPAPLTASRTAPPATSIDQRLIVHVLGEALNGLQAAHDRRIIHRDLKPDNLYITSVKDDPYRAIILDFGVAQLGHDARVVTRTGAMIGTPQYMAPEQHRGAPIDHRADIWAMGAVAYEMITGRLPYQNDSAERNVLTGPEIFHRMMTRPIVDPRHHNPAITEAFAQATLRALAFDPTGRPDTARDLALMLADATPASSGAPSGIDILTKYADELLEGDAVRRAAPPIPEPGRQPPGAGPAARPSTLGAIASQSFPAVSPAPPYRRRRRLVAIALGFVAATAVGVVLLSRHGGIATTTPRTPGSAATPKDDTALVRTPVHDDGHTAATMTGAKVADAARATASVMIAGDAKVTDAPHLAVSLPDAGVTDAPQLTVSPRDAGVTDAPQLTVLPPDAGVTGAPRSTVTPNEASVRGAVSGARAEPVATGKLNVVVLPWAEVWVDGKPLGQTPVTMRVSVGSHRVRLKNDSKEKTLTVTVTSARTAVIDESW